MIIVEGTGRVSVRCALQVLLNTNKNAKCVLKTVKYVIPTINVHNAKRAMH